MNYNIKTGSKTYNSSIIILYDLITLKSQINIIRMYSRLIK